MSVIISNAYFRNLFGLKPIYKCTSCGVNKVKCNCTMCIYSGDSVCIGCKEQKPLTQNNLVNEKKSLSQNKSSNERKRSNSVREFVPPNLFDDDSNSDSESVACEDSTNISDESELKSFIAPN